MLENTQPHHDHKHTPPEFEFWDWESIIKTALLLIFIVAVIFFIFQWPDFKLKQREKSLDRITTAQIVNIKKNMNMHQGRSGNGNVYLINIVVNYKYMALGKLYDGVEVIPDEGNTEAFIHKLISSEVSEIHIRYSHTDPSKSDIVLE